MHPQPRSSNRLLAVLLTGQFMANVDTAIVNIAAPSIHENLHASGGELELVVAGYALAYAMLLITGARLGGMRGYGRIFLAGLIGFTLASLACGLAPNVAALIASRVAQGAAAALMVPQVLSGIQLNFSGMQRARAFGFYAVALSGGAVAGQILGGMLISANILGSGWRPIFLINVPIGIALIIAAARHLPFDGGDRSNRIDLRGAAALSLAVLLAVLPLMLGRDLHWPFWTWLSLGASIPALALFVAIERRVVERGGYPLVNLDIFTRPAFRSGLLAFAAPTSTYYALLFILALYLQQGLGKSPLYSGLALVAWVAAFGVAGPLLPRVPLRMTRFVTPIGDLVLTMAYLGLCAFALLTGHAGGLTLFALLGLGGLGLGIGFSSLVAHLTSAIDAHYAADISGIITTTSQIAGVAGVAVFGGVYLALATTTGPHAATTAFAIVTACLAASTLAAAVAALQSTRPMPPTAEVLEGEDAA
ncbi:MAG: MFS transporter [Vulcanimicrobiaceae bacterium]